MVDSDMLKDGIKYVLNSGENLFLDNEGNDYHQHKYYLKFAIVDSSNNSIVSDIYDTNTELISEYYYQGWESDNPKMESEYKMAIILETWESWYSVSRHYGQNLEDEKLNEREVVYIINK